MMNVSEYAVDVGKEEKEILNLCKKLNINVSSSEDMLSDDDIIMLDNEIANMVEEEVEEEIIEDEEEFEEELEEIASNEKKEIRSSKKPIKKNIQNNDNFKEKRKEMYKHKEKLQSNLAEDDENVILYKENMTVGELASSLGEPVGQIIKKLMGLGMMANINASLDFDTVEIIVADYNKTLKNDTEESEEIGE